MMKSIIKHFGILITGIWGLLACQEQQASFPVRETAQTDAFYSLASLQALQKAWETNPESDMTAYQLALWYFHRKEYNKAQEFIAKAIEIQEKAEYYLLQARCENALKNFVEAKKSLQKALKLQKNDFQILLFAFQFAIEQSEWQEAEIVLQRLEKLYPEASQITFAKGKLAFLKNDTLQAYQFLQKSIHQNPTLAESYKLLSHLYNQQNQPAKAIEWANKGLKIKPLYDSLLLEKAMAWQKLKEKDSASVYFLKAYQQNNRLYQASFFLGEEAFKAEKYQVAFNFLENAYRYAPALPKLAYYLGVCYEKQGKNEMALEFYQKAIKQDSEDMQARQALYFLKEKLERQRLQRIQDSLWRLQNQNQK
ncbi:MAG: tetratricopeptide repeat protein [Raineya sp.]|nr:tetratricopeptide repeat protein [Raineya sp.]